MLLKRRSASLIVLLRSPQRRLCVFRTGHPARTKVPRSQARDSPTRVHKGWPVECSRSEAGPLSQTARRGASGTSAHARQRPLAPQRRHKRGSFVAGSLMGPRSTSVLGMPRPPMTSVHLPRHMLDTLLLRRRHTPRRGRILDALEHHLPHALHDSEPTVNTTTERDSTARNSEASTQSGCKMVKQRRQTSQL